MNNSGIFQSISEVVQRLSNGQKKAFWLIGDISCYILASFIVHFIFLDIIKLPYKYIASYIALSIIIYIIFNILWKQLNILNRYRDVMDLAQLFFTVFFSAILSATICFLVFSIFSYRFTLFSGILAAFFSVFLRFIWQFIYLTAKKETPPEKQIKRVLLLGAGDGGALFMESYRKKPQNIRVVGIIDQDPSKKGQILGGERVLGGHSAIAEAVRTLSVDQIIIAIPSMKPENYEEILSLANELKVDVYTMPKVEEVLQGIHKPTQNLQKVKIEDLLGRPEVELDDGFLTKELEGKTILITGAGGSIGSEISRQVTKYNPKRVVLLGHGENSIYLIYHELIKKGSMTEFAPIIADIQDYERILQIMEKEKPHIVYHAAAHKHVPLMELNPCEAYKNNILGTYNVAKAVHEAKVEKMVMISSDKAVRPPNVMGATKRVAELVITGMNEISQSTFCAVRFGNVLGSRGSVIPVFEKQIAQGGPVTVTDFRMTRYFMTIPEASKLVIHAGANAQGGEVFILDMGQPVKILDLAKKMILLSGKTEEEIEIKEIGIRPGEKLYEELLVNMNSIEEKIQEKIFIGRVAKPSLEKVDGFIEKIDSLPPDQMKEAIIGFANKEANQDM